MALVIVGESRCMICNRLLEDEHQVTSLPAFVSNRRDPLFRFNDAAFHRSCFSADPLAGAAAERSANVTRFGGPGYRRCVVCGEEVSDPDDHFGVGFLTDDRTSPVFEFNYLHLHRSHFAQWDRADYFRQRLQAFLASEAWEGPQVSFDASPQWVQEANVRRP
jgi:hypothetical protein